jgi:hypothetical protein
VLSLSSALPALALNLSDIACSASAGGSFIQCCIHSAHAAASGALGCPAYDGRGIAGHRCRAVASPGLDRCGHHRHSAPRPPGLILGIVLVLFFVFLFLVFFVLILLISVTTSTTVSRLIHQGQAACYALRKLFIISSYKFWKCSSCYRRPKRLFPLRNRASHVNFFVKCVLNQAAVLKGEPQSSQKKLNFA